MHVSAANLGFVRLGCLAIWMVAAGAAWADPAAAEAHYKKGMSEFYLDHWDSAAAEFEAGFREEPRPAFLFNIGKAQASAGRPQQAIDAYEKYLRLEPESSERAFVEGEIVRLKNVHAQNAAAALAHDEAVQRERTAVVARRHRRNAIIGGVVGGVLAVGLGLGLGLGLTLGRADHFAHNLPDIGPNKP
jgi:tetratricopeptide (TPR) repeat protein